MHPTDCSLIVHKITITGITGYACPWTSREKVIDSQDKKFYKSLQVINAGEGVEKREPSYPVGGNAN